MAFIPCDIMLKPHNVWECECEDCKQWRLKTEEIRRRAFERCRLADEAHQKAQSGFPLMQSSQITQIT